MSNYLHSLTLARWLDDTHILIARRGDNLQALDRAIANYCALRSTPSQCLGATDKLKKAFESWVLHKMQQAGQGMWHPGLFQDARKNRVWQGDRRNDRGAMTRLYACLYTDAQVAATAAIQRENLLQAEREAIAYMQECTEKLAAKLFAGKTCQFRVMSTRRAAAITGPDGRRTDDPRSAGPAPQAGRLDRARAYYDAHQDQWWSRARLAGQAGDNLGSAFLHTEHAVVMLRSGVTSDDHSKARIANWLLAILSEVARDHLPASVVNAFIAVYESFFSEVVATLVPVLGPVATTMSGAMKIAQSVRQSHAAQSIEAKPFAKGQSAVAAIQAVTRLMHEQANMQGRLGARQAAFGVGRLVAELLPGGQGVSIGIAAGKAVGDLIIMFQFFMVDWKQREQVNALLAGLEDPDLPGNTRTSLSTSIDLFARCPLLAAYWVLIAETSSVIGICADDLAADSFMQQVEEISRTCLADLRSAAADLVANHPLVIPELSAHRLIAEASSATPHSTRYRRVVDTIKDSFCGWTIYRRAVRLFPAPAWKDRLVGLSSEEYFAQQAAAAARGSATQPAQTPARAAGVQGLMDRLARR